MLVLVTRPRPDAEAFAEALAARGHEALVEPLLEVALAEASALPVELDAFQALLVTSANGLRAFAALSERRDLPVFAVGPASAEAATAAGFARVESAEGDVDDLIRLVRSRLSPEDGVLLHAAGKTLAGDLKGELEAAGFTVTRAVLYTAEAATRLSDAAQAALRDGRLGAVAVFSPRTAETFVALLREAGLAEACRSLRALCLSAAVAAKLEALDWAALEVAARPETEALLALLDRPAAAGEAWTGPRTGPGMGDEKDKGMAEQDGAAAPGEKASSAAEPAAVSVIGRFGGIRPMAQKLGIAVSTVQGWREREVIPKGRHGQIRAAAAAGGIALPEDELEASGNRPDSEAAPAAAKPAEASAPEPETPKHDAPKPADPKPASGEASKPATRTSMATAAASGPKPGPAAAAVGAGGGWLFGFVIGALVFLGGLGIAVLSRDTWLPLLGEPAGTVVAEPSPELLERLDALEKALSAQEGAAGAEFAAEIDRLRSALSRVEAEVGAGASTSTEAQATLSGLESRLAKLDRRVAELSGKAAADSGLRADLDRLAARLAQIEQRLEALPRFNSDGRSALPEQVAVVLAIAQLRDALRRPAPFEREFAALSRLAEGDAELSGVLDTLSPYAADGIPTRESLRADFPQVARAVAAAGAGDGEEGWLAGVRRRLSDLVTVRPVGGDATGESPGAVAARAEARVAAGDLAGAQAELDALSGRAAEAAADWGEAARARAAAEDALQRLSARVADSLTPNLAAEAPSATAQEPAPQRRPKRRPKRRPRRRLRLRRRRCRIRSPRRRPKPQKKQIRSPVPRAKPPPTRTRSRRWAVAGMWRALFYFFKLAILVGVAFWLAERPGELSLTWHGYRIETSVGVLLLGVYAAVLIGASFYFIWRQLRRVPFLASDSIQLGRKRRGYKALTQGMVAVAAGDAEEARRMAKKAEVLLDEPPLTMLLQAQAAQLGGDEAAAKRYFKAMLDRDETRFMGLRGLLMQALRDGDQALALDYLEQARKIRPDAHWVINGLLDLQLQRGDLAGAQDSVTRARKARALPPAEASRRRAVLLVAQAQEAQAAGDNQRALKHLREAGKLTEDLLSGTLLEAELLLAEGKDRAAAKLAERAWPKAPHPRLAELYLRALGEGKGVAGLKAVVRLTETAPEHRESLLARARAALDARLWGEARRYLAAAQDVGPGEAICRLMAKLEDSEHGDVAAARNWLDKATQAPAEPAWVCGSCGAAAPEWSATCTACKSFDTIAWRRPPGVATPRLAEPQAAAEAAPAAATGTTGPTIDALPAQSRRIEGG